MLFSDRLKRAFSKETALTLALWAGPLLFLAVFFYYPLAAIFTTSFSGLNWAKVQSVQITRPLQFTLLQAGLSTLLTLAAGLPAAYVFARYEFKGKRLLQALVTLPFIMPTVVAAAGFNALLGPRGWVNLGLMGLFNLENPPLVFLNTLWAILLAHVFYNTTIVIRLVGSAWQGIDVRLEQAAATLGANPWQAFRAVTWPLLRPAILAAALLVFIFDFTSFGVVLILGGPQYATLEVDIYMQAMTMLNLPLAGLLSMVQMACMLVLTLLHNHLGGGSFVALSSRMRQAAVRWPRTLRQKLLVGSVVVFLLVLMISPLAALAARSFTRLEAGRGERGAVVPGLTLTYYMELFQNRRGSLFYVPPVQALGNSLLFAAGTAALALPLGFLASYALRRKSRLNRWLDALLMLPLGTSAVTLGLGFVLVFNRPPIDLHDFPLNLSLAHSLVALPFVVRTLLPALSSIPSSLRQSAAMLGAGPLRAWLLVELPLVARATLVAGVFAFTLSLGEFGATSFLARPDQPTLPVAIYRFLSQPGALNYGQALAMSTLLMAFTTLGVFLIDKFGYKQ